MGTFGLGMTEYMMMSILPDLAHTYGVGISQAGHLISAYAIGVCVGAPAVAVFMRNMPLRRILLWLMALYAVGNCVFALSGRFWLGLVGRFLTGLPHGAFFGTGSIVACRLMPGRQTTAVALMTLGMTVANLVGVPLGSFVANTLSWKYIFLFDALWGLVTLWAIAVMVKDAGALTHSGIRGEFRFLRHASPWILIGVTTLCQGGAFAMYSYVTPIMGEGGLALTYIPLFMIVVGAAMCLGNYFSGVLSDRFTPARVALWVGIVMVGALAATFFAAKCFWLSGGAVAVTAGCLFALSSPMQFLLIKYSPGGELMGGAMVQVAFNLGNAIGAFLGGLPIAAGRAASWSALSGLPLTLVSVGLMLWFIRRTQSVSAGGSASGSASASD